jgi:hypothetical protein
VDEPPGVTLDGTIEPDIGLQPSWDPYADPSQQQPPAGVPADPYGQGGYDPSAQGAETSLMGVRFLQQIRFEYEWLAGDSGDDFGMNSLELSGTFGVPISYALAPVLITPGFAVHYLEGPDSPGSDLPPRVYDAWLDVGWRPQLTPWLSAELGVRPGLFTDFAKGDSEALRIQGRGLGIVTISPRAQVVAGVLYLDRLDVKILPAGGLIWTPNEDTRYEILFPNPKLAQRITTIGNTDWWAYVAGEYGGDAWAVSRSVGRDEVDYEDLRVIVGLEWVNFSGLKGYFEAGWVFERELTFRSGVGNIDPDETVMLRAGLLY